MIKVQIVCNKCEWYSRMPDSPAVCKEPSLVKQDPIEGGPIYSGCHFVNQHGSCKLYKERGTTTVDKTNLIGKISIGLLVIVAVALVISFC